MAIKGSMNLGLSDELKTAFPDLLPLPRPSVVDQEIKDPNWLAGFTCRGVEGCFRIKVQKNLTTRAGVQVLLEFQLTQHIRDELLLKSFSTYFNCGKHYKAKGGEWGDFSVVLFSDITDKIIPFFKEYPIKGIKAKDFEDFCEAALIIKQGDHLTENGLSKILGDPPPCPPQG